MSNWPATKARPVLAALQRIGWVQPQMAAKQGTIKRLVSEKNFGFIVAASDNAEYFFHASACASEPFDSLREGQDVTFDVGQGPKGPRAENMRLV